MKEKNYKEAIKAFDKGNCLLDEIRNGKVVYRKLKTPWSYTARIGKANAMLLNKDYERAHSAFWYFYTESVQRDE